MKQLGPDAPQHDGTPGHIGYFGAALSSTAFTK